MLYLHDVWVNWFEGEENGYNVCEFHEWRKTDGVELLGRVPLVVLEKEVYDLIENDLCELPSSLLDYIYEKATLRKNHNDIRLDYCAVVTDGNRIIAFDTNGYDIPLRKSRMIPRVEQTIYETIQRVRPYKMDTTEIAKRKKAYSLLLPEPITMRGLTRTERKFKQLLFMAIEQLKQGSVEEVRYWYLEWNSSSYEEIKAFNKQQLLDKLCDEVKNGWSQRQFVFAKTLLKGQVFLEKIWKEEEKEMNIVSKN